MKSNDKGGKRKRVAKEAVQRLPLFMSAGRSRVIEQVAMSAAISREKQRYLRWAADAAGVSREEAEVMMFDRALGDYMKRDEAWAAEKAERGGGDDAALGAEERTSDPRPATSPDAGPTSAGGVASPVAAFTRAPSPSPRPEVGDGPAKQSNGAAAAR